MVAPEHPVVRRLRVLRVITRLNVGGPAIQAVLLSARLDPDRFESLLVAGTESVVEGNMIQLGRLDAPTALRRIPALGREISPLDDLRALGSLIRLMREFRPDIVHTHLAKAGTLGRLAARIAGVPIVVHTYHGTVFRGYFGSLRSRLFLEIERAVARVTTRLIAITAGQRRELIALGIGNERKVVEIPLGLELAAFVDVTSRADARALLGLAANEPVVAIVARLVPIKDVGLFLRALAQASSAPTGIVVGDGEERADLEAQAAALGIASRCRFLGWRRDVRSIYAAADVVALTSRSEGSPVSIIEAMAAGSAVVCTDVGGVSDVVTSDVSGILVKHGDVDALAASIDRLVGDPDLRLRLGEEARRAVYPRYDVSRLVTDIAALYTALASE
jgi:glycosyltransferase involved in cell wall biosynthesis